MSALRASKYLSSALVSTKMSGLSALNQLLRACPVKRETKLKTILMALLLISGGLEEIESHIMRYAMIIEPGERNYSAYLPDLPGCVATGKTIEELHQRMGEAIELHLDGMREDGLTIPKPTSLADYVEAA
jgi:predicted RNase H-like HicB family nuclease